MFLDKVKSESFCFEPLSLTHTFDWCCDADVSAALHVIHENFGFSLVTPNKIAMQKS